MKRTRHANLGALIEEIGSKQIKVGFFEGSRYPDGTPIASVAAVQVFGSVKKNIPKRDFMRPKLKDGAANYKKGIASAFSRAARGEATIDQGLSLVGEVASGDVKEGIIEMRAPALSERTIAARASRHYAGKASDKPLVDTGQMLRAVSYAVEDA